MIKNIFLIFSLALFCLRPSAQPTHAIVDVEKEFKEAKDLFLRGEYALAFPLLQELHDEYTAYSKTNYSYLHEDVAYYYLVCGLKLKQPVAENEAVKYIDAGNSKPRIQLLSYHLGRYYFQKQNFEKCINYYEKAGLDNLNNKDIADAKFEMAYAYFNLKDFVKSKDLFNEIHQLPDNKYYMPANYYYGFISYYDKKFDEAMRSFKVVENHKDYKSIVPYYIAEILYFQGKKDEALTYAKNILSSDGNLYYRQQLNLLVGQIFFEKKDFKKALPLLEPYVNTAAGKANKKIIYELSYCYYETGQLNKATDGFKQLSSEKDSMGQNSMYLLADCYLKTGQKSNARNAFQYCAFNSNNKEQQKVALFNYAKLSYELGFQDVALREIKYYLTNYPGSQYDTEAKELFVTLLANTNNFADAIVVYNAISTPTQRMQKIYPKILYGKAVEYINDQQLGKANELLDKILVDKNAAEISAYANFWKGEIAYRLLQYDTVIKYTSAFLAGKVASFGEVNAISANYNLGYSLLQKSDYKQALNHFGQVAKVIKSNSSMVEQDAYLHSADCYFMLKDYVKANAMYSAVVDNHLLQSDYALFQKAMIAGINNAAEKIKLLNGLMHQYPKSNLIEDINLEIANTYMADEKFAAAIPFLKNIIASGNINLQPKAYLKLGLSFYNTDKNEDALENYKILIQKYPSTSEADEAIDNIKNIYVEKGKPDEYIALMKKYGKNVDVSEADSLTYNSAWLIYNNNDCVNSIQAFTDYLNKYPGGTYNIDAVFFRSECYNKSKDWTNALEGYEYVNNKGLGRHFENATIAAARITYFELKDYEKAKEYFDILKNNTTNLDIQLEALRGLVRCYYQLKDYSQANTACEALLSKKGISADDKSVSFLILGKYQQSVNDCAAAIASFKSCVAINKAAWGAEARYEIANCQLATGDIKLAEKSALLVIKETASYDLWVTKSYILLGDIFMLQKDYFNAKATYESIVKNASIATLREEAQQKLDKAIQEENANTDN